MPPRRPKRTEPLARVPSLKARALQALARREHTRAELQARLGPHAQDPAELQTLLDELEHRGWLSEARFVEQLTTVRRRKYGTARILHELKEKGVSAEALDDARRRLRAGELEAAREVRRRKFGDLPATSEARARQARFLAGRGFAAEIVHAALREPEDP